VTAPLAGLKVIDLGKNSPAPLAAMMLADFGAEVIHIARPGATGLGDTHAGGEPRKPVSVRFQPHDALMRGKRSLALDLKSRQGREIFLKLAAAADVLVEEMRPGKMAALGLGYEDLRESCPRLIYCSISGYGQDGPLREAGGHDINYLAMSGALDMIRAADGTPLSPQNLLSDNGGGAMSAVAGILTAIIARGKTGRGQHVDVALTDAVVYLMADFYAAALDGGGGDSSRWRGTFTGDLPHYRPYRCADGKWLSIGALETALARSVFEKLRRPDLFALLEDEKHWPEVAAALEKIFASQTRDHWCALFNGRDDAVTPVLSPEEAARHPQTKARRMVGERHGVMQVGVAPKLSQTPGDIRGRPAAPGEHSAEILRELGISTGQISALKEAGVTQ